MSEKLKNIPSKLRIKELYDRYTPFLETIMNNIHKLLKEKVMLSSQPTFKTRIKSFPSYYKKLLRLKPDEEYSSKYLTTLTDIMGIRIICGFLQDIGEVRKQLEYYFSVQEVEIKGASQSFKEFGYESVHVLIKIPQDCIPEKLPFDIVLPEDLVCEIQIRTILQDAWAEVEHELIYKTEFSPFDMPLRRKLASINASLSLADIIFQEIRDYQSKLQSEMNQRRHSFYDIADNLTNIPKISNKYSSTNIERVNPYVQGTIDDLLLQAIHAHNLGDLDKAIYIYTEIINSKPEPNNIVLSVIYKHRGMAFFAQNDYEKSLEDFNKAYSYDSANFRAIYYAGIVYSVLKDYEKAIECYTKSLEINEYQSHTFFRRSIAYFEIKNYENALSDIVSAQKLGLTDDAVEELHKKIVEKFDMNM